MTTPFKKIPREIPRKKCKACGGDDVFVIPGSPTFTVCRNKECPSAKVQEPPEIEIPTKMTRKKKP